MCDIQQPGARAGDDLGMSPSNKTRSRKIRSASSRTTRPAIRTGPRITALELARAFLGDDPDPERRQDITDAAICAGTWLADEGRPGRWDTLDIASVVERSSPPSDFHRDGLLLNLTALLGFAGMNGLIPGEKVLAYLQDILKLTSRPVIRDFVARARAEFTRPAN